jgi:predicted HicB family RNase H-like nuclease
MKNQNGPQERLIHIRLSEEIHKRLRIKVAELDTSMQDWVAGLVEKELDKTEKRKA